MNGLMMNTNNMVWHYTRLSLLPLIEESGELIPKSEADEYRRLLNSSWNLSQTPFVWFSSDQHYEQLCTNIGGGLRERFLTTQQLLDRDEGIRFGILASDSRLLNWEKTCEVGGLNRKERRRRKRFAVKAKKLGSDVYGWYTSLQPIPLTDLHLQRWYAGGWVDFE